MQENIGKLGKALLGAAMLTSAQTTALADNDKPLTIHTIQSPEYSALLAFNGIKPYLPYLFFAYDPIKEVYSGNASSALQKVIKYCKLDNGKIKWIYDGIMHYDVTISNFGQALRGEIHDFRCYKNGQVFVPQKAKLNRDARSIRYILSGKKTYIFEVFEPIGGYGIARLMNAAAQAYASNHGEACNDKQADAVGIAYNIVFNGEIINETPRSFKMKINLDKQSNIILGCLNYKTKKTTSYHKIYISNVPLLKPIEYTLQFQKKQIPTPRHRPKAIKK